VLELLARSGHRVLQAGEPVPGLRTARARRTASAISFFRAG